MKNAKEELVDLECDYRYYEMKFEKEDNDETASVYFEQMYQIGEKIDELKK